VGFDTSSGSSPDRILVTMPILGGGYWPFWSSVLHRPSPITGHDLTEADAIVFNGEVDAKVSQVVAVNIQPLKVANSRLPDSLAVARAILDRCQKEPGKILTAVRVLRFVEIDKEFRFADLDRFVAAFQAVRQIVFDTFLAASKDLDGRLPASARDGFLRDLGVFISEELVKCLVVRELASAPRTDQE
jgi:hypothetical protein